MTHFLHVCSAYGKLAFICLLFYLTQSDSSLKNCHLNSYPIIKIVVRSCMNNKTKNHLVMTSQQV